MDRQEIFNKAVRGLRRQGFRQSVDDGGHCLYRGPDGRKCAIGHCISNKDYDPNWDGDEYECAIFFVADIHQQDYNHPDFLFLTGLQACHDGGYEPVQMKSKLKTFAKEYDLLFPED